MKSPISLAVIAISFLLALGTSLAVENIVIGIYTQHYWYEDHKSIDGATLTYLDPSYINLAAMSGAKVVPIYSYTSKD
jgi:hypothetical protein